MAKVAIKNENITSFGGIYHIMDVFSKLGFERQGGQATDRYLRSNIHIPLYLTRNNAAELRLSVNRKVKGLL